MRGFGCAAEEQMEKCIKTTEFTLCLPCEGRKERIRPHTSDNNVSMPLTTKLSQASVCLASFEGVPNWPGGGPYANQFWERVTPFGVAFGLRNLADRLHG